MACHFYYINQSLTYHIAYYAKSTCAATRGVLRRRNRMISCGFVTDHPLFASKYRSNAANPVSYLEIRTGTGIRESNVRVTPPRRSSRKRAWL
jgi:hypothetical protein